MGKEGYRKKPYKIKNAPILEKILNIHVFIHLLTNSTHTGYCYTRTCDLFYLKILLAYINCIHNGFHYNIFIHVYNILYIPLTYVLDE
jgi:hypothetical protein